MSMKTTQLKEAILKKQLDTQFMKLYLTEESVAWQRKRYVDAINAFETLYGVKEVAIYSSPGRTEIGGNHTDHQRGKVLAASINLDAIAVVAKTETNKACIQSEGYPYCEIDLCDLSVKNEEEGTTAALVRGVANGVFAHGYQIGGFEAYITSDVFSGSGLSSSAAYEVLIGNVLSGLYNANRVDAVTIAKISQEAERTYFGKPCGLMDQMACSVGGMVYIDFSNENCPEVKKVNADFQDLEHCLCIVDTKGSHADLIDEYAAVPEEMKAVARCFGKELLCEVDPEAFYEKIVQVSQEVGDRAVLRAMHWFSENARVEAEVAALERGDFEKFKAMVKESGDSSYKYLQNVFSVKNVKEQKVSLALAISEDILKKEGVSRVHGGGFAGTIQAFVPKDMVLKYKENIEKVFGKDTCFVLQIRPLGGTKVI